MNITMFHDLDTGFLSATLKPAFQALGHTCTVIQTLTTYLEEPATHIDYQLNTMTDEAIAQLTTIYKETDLFIIRSVTDLTLRLSGILPYLNKHNTIFKVHGSELRERNVPYSLRTWRINWHNKEPLLCGPRDPSLFPLYHKNTITHIERPCAFDTFPRKNTNKEQPFALTSPTNIERKGTQSLIDNWKSHIPLQVLHGVSRIEALKMKAQASYYIDNIGSYKHGPYGMNSVEAWFYKIPVFSNYNPIDEVIVPELSELVYNTKDSNMWMHLEDLVHRPERLNHAYKYALHTHSPHTIALQYIGIYNHILHH